MTRSPCGARRVSSHSTPAAANADRTLTRREKPVHAQCQRRGFVVELNPLLSVLEADAIQPSSDQPVGV